MFYMLSDRESSTKGLIVQHTVVKQNIRVFEIEPDDYWLFHNMERYTSEIAI